MTEVITPAPSGQGNMSVVEQARGQAATWLDDRHPDYRRNGARWEFAQDHYSGEVLDPTKITTYLVRKAQAESEQAYLERAGLADYTPHFATVVDALAGMLFAVEADANRFLGDEETPGLGSYNDRESPMFRLWRNIDGRGTGWLTLFKQLAINLVVTHRAWIIVSRQGDDAVAHVWPAQSVLNWFYDSSGNLAQVLVSETVDQRTDIKNSTKQIQQRWTLYKTDGWERWGKDAKQEPTLLDQGVYERPFTNEAGQPILPIYPVELPLRRQIGWVLAKKANAIFNRESERDHLLRTANFPLLVLVGNNAQYKEAVTDLKAGVRALRHDPSYSTTHTFIAPGTGSATIASDALQRKVEEFYEVAFKEYGQAARVQTATEIQHDVASGIGAFLQMLKAAVDDAENQLMLRVAQIEYPQDEKRWFINHVERSETFVPTDIQDIIDRLKKRYFCAPTDNPVPVGVSGLFQAAKEIATFDGLTIDENEVKAAIMTSEYNRLATLFDKLPIPAEVRVAQTLKLLVANGFVDPTEEVELDNGDTMLAIDKLKAEMLDLALADDEAKKRMSAPLDLFRPMGGGPGGGDLPPGGIAPAAAPVDAVPSPTPGGANL